MVAWIYRSIFLVTLIVSGAAVSVSATMGCGGAAGTGDDSTAGSSGGSGEASVTSLSSLPSLDISTLDTSESSSNVAVPLSKAVAPGGTAGTTIASDTGRPSRSGCEAGMHKRQMFRMAQEVQMPRCYLEAMETAGLISIPTGSLAIYDFRMPEPPAEEQQKKCDGIPEERTEERAACESGDESSKDPLVRIGIVDGALQIDHCEGQDISSRTLMEEATYAANGSIYTINATQNWTWGGETEKSKLSATIDIGSGSVTDGVVTLGDDGTVDVTGHHQGGFGSGMETYSRNGSVNSVGGAFAGEFVDPFSDSTSSFTGRVHAEYDAVKGSAKYSMTGSQPAMRVQDMMPYNLTSTEQIDSFLAIWSSDLGSEITIDSKLCPNSAFNPGNPDPTLKPMVVMEAGETNCPPVTHTGVESFAITNVTSESDYGTQLTQVYTEISNADSPYFTAVNAYDISLLSPSVDSLAFTRNWACDGTATVVDLSQLTAAQFQAMEAPITKCLALEEKLRGNNGMGDYDCHQEEQQDDVNDLLEDVQSGGDHWGTFGGDLHLQSENCEGTNPLGFIPMDPLDVDANVYCIPVEGDCISVTVSESTARPTSDSDQLRFEFGGVGLTIDQIAFSDDASTAVVSWRNDQSQTCEATYQHTLPGQGVFFTEGGAPIDQGFHLAQACLDAGMSEDDPSALDKCGAYCSGAGDQCAPTQPPQ